MSPERDIFANFERMRREIDELFGDVFERSGFAPRRGFSPRVDVYYCGNPPRAVVTVDLAGVTIDEVGLEIRGRKLEIAGERRTQESEGRLYQQIEIEHGPFRRVVELGADVEPESARASYEDGVLRIEIPLRQQEESARQVPISGPAPALRPSDPERSNGGDER
ncbi:MAG: Hsp20/alpha crystallin family protein [Thermoleophilaceae bacterium]